MSSVGPSSCSSMVDELPAPPTSGWIIQLRQHSQVRTRAAVCLLPFYRDVSRRFHPCKTMGAPILYQRLPTTLTSHQDLQSNAADRNKSET